MMDFGLDPEIMANVDQKQDPDIMANVDAPGPTIAKGKKLAAAGSHAALLELPEDAQMQALGFDKPTIDKIKAHPDFRPGMVSDALTAEGMPGTNLAKALKLPVVAQLFSMAKGFSNLGHGVVQGVQQNFGIGEGNPVKDFHNRLNDYQYGSTVGKEPLTGLGEFVGSAMSTPAAPELGEAKGVWQTIKAIPKVAASGALQGVLQPVSNANQDYGQQKLTQAGIGAVLTPVAALTIDKAIGKALSKWKNAREGNIDAAALEVMAEAKAAGVPNINASTVLSRIKELHPEIAAAKKTISDTENKFMSILGSHGMGTNTGEIVSKDVKRAAEKEKGSLDSYFKLRASMAKDIKDTEYPNLYRAIDEKIKKLQLDKFNIEDNQREIQALMEFKDRMTPRAEVKATPNVMDQFGMSVQNPGQPSLPGRRISFAERPSGRNLVNTIRGPGQ